MQATPTLYEGTWDDNMLLRALRPTLDSTGILTQCVDLSGADVGSLAICLHQDAKGQKQVLLLMSSMHNACSSAGFCAYFFVPLHKQVS